MVLVVGVFSVAIISETLEKTGLSTETTSRQTQSTSLIGQTSTSREQFPTGYVIGNPTDIELKTGMSCVSIRNSRGSVSVRFTAQLSGEATAVALDTLPTKGDPRVRVGVQEDSAGMPKGELVSESGFGTVKIPDKGGFVTVNLQRTVPVSKGKVYHIVVQAAEPNSNVTISIVTYNGNSYAEPLNKQDPDVVLADPMMNVLSYDGERWQEENKWPIFVIQYSSGRSEGQPYSLAAPWVIYNATYVGQAIVPASTYRIGKIAFVVSLQGEPKDKLYYEVLDSSNRVLAKGLFAEAGQLSIRVRWIEVTLQSPVTFKAGELYRVVLLSPGTDLKNAYLVYGHEFTYDSSIGYGGLVSQLITSYDYGSRWSLWPDADAIFKLTTA